MKYLSKISLIIVLLLGLILPLFVGADVVISNIRVSNPRNGMIDLSWYTTQSSKGSVQYGLSADNLNFTMGYGAYDYDHKSVLTGLVKDKTYFYKITAEDASGHKVETYIQSFSTKNMTDNRRPTITEYKVLQTTANAVAITWTTDEITKGKITYWEMEQTKRSSVTYNSYVTSHINYIYKLKANTRYAAEVTAIDKDKNIETKYLVFTTSYGTQNGSNLAISNIKPLQLDVNRINDTSALLSWSTNYVTNSTIYYGTKSTSLNKKIVASATPKYEHEILLTNLTPNTTYYYKIVVEKGLYNKRVEATGHSFMTLPKQKNVTTIAQVAGDKIYSSTLDSDYDGYSDQEEIDHKYNPYGYGRTINEVLLRLNNPNSLESKQSAYLKNWLKNNLGAYSIGARDWAVLVNAYTYSGYSEQAIKQSIRFGGKTVHPSIPFAKWQYTSDYITYINR
ncbi:MAG: hypothetical protein QG642_299 [Patescibacteria group bacterium]|nr:hypothetical protein [Patescibacteria group bacterium]